MTTSTDTTTVDEQLVASARFEIARRRAAEEESEVQDLARAKAEALASAERDRQQAEAAEAELARGARAARLWVDHVVAWRDRAAEGDIDLVEYGCILEAAAGVPHYGLAWQARQALSEWLWERLRAAGMDVPVAGRTVFLTNLLAAVELLAEPKEGT